MYKNTKPLPDSFKIKVNPEQSKALQEHLISIGKVWGKHDGLAHLEMPYLFIDTMLGYGDCHNTEYFKSHKFQRIKFKDYFAKVTETKLQGTKAGNNEFKAEPEGILKNPKTNESKLDTEIRTLIMKIQQSMSGILPLEIERLKKENKSLKTTIEAIKEIIQDNPIIKK